MWRKMSLLSCTLVVIGVLIGVPQTYSSTSLYYDDFETGYGNWSNVSSGDNNNWTRTSGSTPSSDTGPLGGANGSSYYVYFETSYGSAYYAGDTAILQGPSINASGIQLTFQYHMYGSNIGTLAVDVLSDGAWIEDVWSISGQQQTSYYAAYASVDLDLSNYAVSQIRFRVTAAGGYQGDIVLDNIEITSTPTDPVAPEFITDPVIMPDAFLDQDYNDSLVDGVWDANGDPLTFSKVSGPDWLSIAEDGELSGIPGSSDIGLDSFEVEVSDGTFQSYATMTIMVSEDAPLTVLNSADFEAGHGGWSNTASGDSDDWTQDSGGTPSSGTGPSAGALGSAYYMYMETSSGSAYSSGDNAILLSPNIYGTNIQFSFYYHMYGSNIGTLAIDVLEGDVWMNDVWSISGQQQSSNSDNYTFAELDLSAYDVQKIRLRGTASGGYRGDIAVDNLEIRGIEGETPIVKTVFATSQGFNGDIGGLSGADAICQAEAQAAGLSGTYKAWLSDNSTSAADRLTHASIPYQLVDGTPIANNWDDLVDGRIANTLNLDASGSQVSGFAWTGSNQDGSKATYNPYDYPNGYQLDLTCNNWTMDTASSHYLGSRGNTNDTGAWSDWWQNDGSPCTSVLGLYCFEQ